jgi:NAD(P)-dependent dehydrogenase (short-subunit alcohol dehydrogenase family)
MAVIGARAYSVPRAMDAADLLRPGLLEGAVVAVTDEATAPGLAALGARTPLLVPGFPLDDDGLAAVAAEFGAVDALVCDGQALFDGAGGGLAGLRAAADGCFAAARALVNAAFIPAASGKIVLLAPEDGATAAALENTARTLGTEWARHGIVITCVHARGRTDALVAFLCSPAGDYYSGCAFGRF